jgi:hypothetical protein
LAVGSVVWWFKELFDVNRLTRVRLVRGDKRMDLTYQNLSTASDEVEEG